MWHGDVPPSVEHLLRENDQNRSFSQTGTFSGFGTVFVRILLRGLTMKPLASATVRLRKKWKRVHWGNSIQPLTVSL